MDLESTNGTMLNKKKIEPARYYELKPYDIINIGLSNRDYVVMKVDKNPNE
jgi:pSer/pThr/pTyr-binding forkhead associated (FHA) protein